MEFKKGIRLGCSGTLLGGVFLTPPFRRARGGLCLLCVSVLLGGFSELEAESPGIMTVTGLVPAVELGPALTHEHLFSTFRMSTSEAETAFDRDAIFVSVVPRLKAARAKALVARLQARGFAPIAGHRLLAVLDGSAPLQTAVLAAWPDTLIQRCLVHKQRNLHGYLRRSDHAESSRLWRRLRLAQGELAGGEALAELRRFVATRKAAGLASLDEAGDPLITLHRLNTLHVSLLSPTNAIENVMRNYRGQNANRPAAG